MKIHSPLFSAYRHIGPVPSGAVSAFQSVAVNFPDVNFAGRRRRCPEQDNPRVKGGDVLGRRRNWQGFRDSTACWQPLSRTSSTSHRAQSTGVLVSECT